MVKERIANAVDFRKHREREHPDRMGGCETDEEINQAALVVEVHEHRGHQQCFHTGDDQSEDHVGFVEPVTANIEPRHSRDRHRHDRPDEQDRSDKEIKPD